MSAKLTIRGSNTAGRRLKVVADRAKNVEPAWPSVGRYLSRQVWIQFTSEGAHFGTPWRPLKPEYRLAKIRMGFNRKILVRSGLLRRNMTSRPMDIEVYNGNSAIFGTADEKALWHHFGTHRNGKRVNYPRPLLRVTRQMERDVKDILSRYITTGRT